MVFEASSSVTKSLKTSLGFDGDMYAGNLGEVGSGFVRLFGNGERVVVEEGEGVGSFVNSFLAFSVVGTTS